MLNSLAKTTTPPEDKTRWGTPPALFRRLNYVFHFTLDGAAEEGNAKCSRFCVHDREFMRLGNDPGARVGSRHLVLPDGRQVFCDGLTMPWAPRAGDEWEPERVFLNPPYGREIEPHLQHAREEAALGALVVALIPHDTSTGWFWRQVHRVAQVEPLSSRVRFEGATGSPNFASALAIYWPGGFWKGASR